MTDGEFLSMSYEEMIDRMIVAPEDLDLPECSAYIAQYLSQYRPLMPPQAHMDNESSLDIKETFGSICVVSVNVISRMMRMLGYRLYIQGVSQPVWSMRHVDSK